MAQPPYESVDQMAGDKPDPETVGDPGDQQFITSRKFSRYAGNPEMQAASAFKKQSAQSIGPMLKQAAQGTARARQPKKKKH